MGRWIICVTVAAASLAVAFWFGIAQRVIDSDQTGLIWAICAIGLVGTISAQWRPSLNDWFCEHGIALLFGLLGTVVGFMGAIGGVVDGNTAAKLAGVETALSTTAVGLVTHIYLLVMQRALSEP